MVKQLQKIFDLWSTQKYSKVSKICSACSSIFFRVSYMFKPTVTILDHLHVNQKRQTSCILNVIYVYRWMLFNKHLFREGTEKYDYASEGIEKKTHCCLTISMFWALWKIKISGKTIRRISLTLVGDVNIASTWKIIRYWIWYAHD